MGRLSRAAESQRLMVAGVLLMMLVVIGTGLVVAVRTLGALNTLSLAASEANHVTELSQTLLVGMLDAESSTRGYVLTRRSTFLVAYSAARNRAEASLGQLEDAVVREPSLAGGVQTLHRLAAARMAVLAAAVLAVEAGGDDQLGRMLDTDAGLTATDTIRTVVERVLQQAAEERDQRLTQLRARERAVMISWRLAALAGVLLLGTAALALLQGRATLLRAQRALEAQAALWQATVENLQDGVAVFDAAGRLVQWNRNLLPLAGLPAGLLRQGTPFARFAKAAAAWEPPVLAGAAAPRSDAAVETRIGDRVLEVWRNAMPGGGQMVTIGDITRRTEAEAIARQAQKMEVLGQLTGGVAHDFNNLLQVVSANLELISVRADAAGPMPPGWLRSRVLAAMEGVHRGARLTRHLLAFARRQPLAPAAIDVARMLAGLDDMLRRTLGPTVALEIDVVGELWAVQADMQQLENAILNLAINGRDAMAGKPADAARLTIEARNTALDEAYCATHPGVAPGQYVMIAVSDAGCGMMPEQAARALEPFYTTKPEGRGTGLGLSMVYGFVKQSGGHLSLYSEPGHGTTVRLYIPRTVDTPAQHEALPSQPPAGRGDMVLLVEDDPAVNASTGLALRGLGYRVEEAASADAALAMIEQGLRPDLLFCDVMTPGMLDARSLAERAKGLMPALAVLFTSGYSEYTAAQQGGLDPGAPLISKPWRIDELAIRLRAAIDHARPSGRPGRLRILLVEDDALVRMITADMLADMGHEVVQAADATGALGALAGVGLLITDFGLAETDGLTLVAAARDIVPGLPVILASGREAPPDIAEGAVWLQKPYDNKALGVAIGHVVAGRPVA